MGNATKASRAFRASIAHWGVTEYGLLLTIWCAMSAPFYLWGWGIFSVLGLPAFLGSILGLTYVAKRYMPRAPALSSHRDHVITLAASVQSQLYQGALSYTEGIPRGTWIVDMGSSRTATDAVISEQGFRALWDTGRLLPKLREFKVATALQDTDTLHNFLVSIAFTDAGQTYQATYVIPRDCKAPKVRAWVQAILLTCVSIGQSGLPEYPVLARR